jgi:hypothetical protein
MTDKRTRLLLFLIGLILLGGSGLTVCLGAGVFGTNRADRRIFDKTVVRWWAEGGWMSYAVVVAIGIAFVALGLFLMLAQLRRNDGLDRTSNFTLPQPDGRGETALRAAALSHAIEGDLCSSSDVESAMVGLFGSYPDIEMRIVLSVTDDTHLDGLSRHVDQVVDRVHTVTGARPAPLRVTVRFTDNRRPRQLA